MNDLGPEELDLTASEPEHVSPEEELQRNVMAALLGCEPTLTNDRYVYAMRHLREEFLDRRFQVIWTLLHRFYAITGSSPQPSMFRELIGSTQTISLPDKVEIAALFDALWESDASEANFRFGIHRLAEIWGDNRFITAAGLSQQMISGSVRVGNKPLSGRVDAMTYMHQAMAEISNAATPESASGDINLEGSKIVESFFAAKRGDAATGCLTGLASLDGITRGVQPGELWLLAGFTSEGKSKILYNIAWNAAYMQGKNVLFATCEATRDQVHRNLFTRHSHLPKFGRDGGLRYSDIRNGTLSEDDVAVLRLVSQDMKDWGTNGYGHMFVFSIPEKSPVGYIGEVLRRESRSYHVDIVCVDYFGLLGSSTRRTQRREELDDVLVAAKRLAVDSNGGSGVAVVSPWQISREAWREAQVKQEYTKSALSDTSQAERSTDVIMSILAQAESPNQLKAQILKNRDGEAGQQFTLYKDFATSLVTSDDLDGAGAMF